MALSRGPWNLGYRTETGIDWFSGFRPDTSQGPEADRAAALEHGQWFIKHNAKYNPDRFPPSGELIVATRAEMRNYLFRPEFAALEPRMQQLLITLFPVLGERLADDHATFFDIKPVDQLVFTASAYLHHLGLSQLCPRCAGSGKHSYCSGWGNTCFKCGTSATSPAPGRLMPKVTKKLVAAVATRVKVCQEPALAAPAGDQPGDAISGRAHCHDKENV